MFEPSIPPVPQDGNAMSMTARYETIHFGIPDPVFALPPDSLGILIRWRKPVSFDDVEGGTIGTRSTMWNAARALVQNEGGVDAIEFVRDGAPFDRSEPDEEQWGS